VKNVHKSPYVKNFEKPSNETLEAKIQRLNKLNVNMQHLKKDPKYKEVFQEKNF
jgi:hypothetical protein